MLHLVLFNVYNALRVQLVLMLLLQWRASRGNTVASGIISVINVLVVNSVLVEQPCLLHALREHTLIMDQLCVCYALQVFIYVMTCLHTFWNWFVLSYLGHMCPSSGSEPIECQTGFYSLGNATACITCPAGYSCLSSSNIPVACSHGEYSLEGNHTCIQCEAGYSCGDSKSLPRSCDPGGCLCSVI